MSRIGKLPIRLPEKVEVKVAGTSITVKGPRGELSRRLPTLVSAEVAAGELSFTRAGESRQARANHGLARALVNNMVTGVSKGFTRTLEINGVGYRAAVAGGYLRFDLGYSHPILFELPKGVTADVQRNVVVTLTSIDRELLGMTAATIRGFRPPEPYKGKGIKYSDETIIRKAGKQGGKK